MSTVEQQVKAIVAEQLGVKQEQVTNDASFVDDLGADSLDTVELVMALEEEFEIEIPDEDAEKITTVHQAIEYINERRTKGLSPSALRGDRLHRPSPKFGFAQNNRKPGQGRKMLNFAVCGVAAGMDARAVPSTPRVFIQVACEQASCRRHGPWHHLSRGERRAVGVGCHFEG